MEVSSNNLLNILLPKQNTILKEAMKNADSKELLNMFKDKNSSLSDILKSVFEQIKNQEGSNKSLLNLLKNSNLLKDLGSFGNNLQNLTNELKSNETLNKFSPSLEKFLTNIKDINSKNLTENIKNSGIFLESKLNNTHKLDNKSLLNDLKTVMLKLQDEISKNSDGKQNNELSKLTEKVLIQIETSQMISLLSNSNYVHIPFLWDLLEDGNIEVNKTKEDNNFCKINLLLKNYGKIELFLAMYSENELEINANFENKELKKQFQEKLSDLKTSIKDASLNLTSIRINDLIEKTDDKTKVFENNSYDKHSNLLNQVDIKI